MDTAVVRKSARARTTSTRRTERHASSSVCRIWPRGTSRCRTGSWRRRANGWCTRRIPMGAGAGFRRVHRQSRKLRSRLRPLASLPCDGDATAAVSAGAGWLTKRIESAEWLHPSPIGFYFAKLWYYERLYPMIFTVAALGKARDYLAQSRQFTDRGSRPSARVLPAVS